MKDLYYAHKINQRCFIVLEKNGKCIIRCKDGEYRKAYKKDLFKI
jgi:hypothetical protein